MRPGWNVRIRDRGGASGRARFVRTRRRVKLLVGLTVGWLCFCVLGAVVSIHNNEKLKKDAEWVRAKRRIGPRGQIIDRRGYTLADNLKVQKLTADLKYVSLAPKARACVELDAVEAAQAQDKHDAFVKTVAQRLASALTPQRAETKDRASQVEETAKELYAQLTQDLERVTLLSGLDPKQSARLRRLLKSDPSLSFLHLEPRTLEFSVTRHGGVPADVKERRKRCRIVATQLAKATAPLLGVEQRRLYDLFYASLRLNKDRQLLPSVTRLSRRGRLRRVEAAIAAPKSQVKGLWFTQALVVNPRRATAAALKTLPGCNEVAECKALPEGAAWGKAKDRKCAAIPGYTTRKVCLPECVKIDALTLASRRRWAGAVMSSYLGEVSEAASEGGYGKVQDRVFKQLRSLVRNLGRRARYVVLKKSLTTRQVEAVSRLKRDGVLPGIHFEEDYRRYYPSGVTGGPLLGHPAWVGSLEHMLDRLLRGVPYTEYLTPTVDGRYLPTWGTHNPNDMAGKTAVVTIDRSVQAVAEYLLAEGVAEGRAKHGTAVVLDTKTGEVLALAQSQEVDPNEPIRAGMVTKVRATRDVPEPGSTMKSVVYAIALHLGVIKPTDTFQTAQGFSVANKVIRDSHQHGLLTARDCLKVSSNVCFAQIAQKIGACRLEAHLKKFGLCQPTDVGLSAESGGICAPCKDWSRAQFANIAFGQGISTTALQMARAYSVFATGGIVRRPRLIRQVQDVHGKVQEGGEFRVENGERIISEFAARETMAALSLVTKKGGTARRVKLPHYTIAGKTGTAQQAENGRYSDTHWVASFAGVVPADNPRFVVYVSIDTPDKRHPRFPNLVIRTGGQIAGPVVREIARFLLPYEGVPYSPGAPYLDYEDPDKARRLAETKRLKKQARHAKMTPASPPKQPSTQPIKVPSGYVRVPSLRGLSLSKALQTALGEGALLRPKGSGVVFQQSPAPGVVVKRGTRIEVLLLPPSAISQLSGAHRPKEAGR